MKVPPKRKGNLQLTPPKPTPASTTLNESPSEKEGKLVQDGDFKVSGVTLNESPSEKEGKSSAFSPVRSRSIDPQ